MSEEAARVLSVLGGLAPLELAEGWDNVGLIVDPHSAGATVGLEFSRAFLAIDLTLEVLDEAASVAADLIVAYHPPIFSGLKRLRRAIPAEAAILRALELGLTIYSPHTALDAARGGMAEWLGQACGPGAMSPITPVARDASLGAGRLMTLTDAIPLDMALARIKEHLGLERLRLAAPEPAPLVRTLAVCPGSGGALFQEVTHADLFLTGEMRHHDILARRAAGSAVVLTDHTNCERGYLPLLAERLCSACPGLEVVVSRLDGDPLRIV